ncbi:DUF4407 domain-containing protein [Dawidia soli]|uniref:DUF4407 domain-containing protein n=1 Tax=Dawidia soli TaxID=2782352 RepID=A0AAP2D9Q1_9BACT|nr:DUF4407 domain-containing protein [Dawidia soli]MBT1686935.1 DUF4407 domain-containing protein [Dawidia soli]
MNNAKPADAAPPPRRISRVMRFFIFCSAANKEILQRCPLSEYHKYASIGATIFFTGVLAGLSGGYALYTVFDSVVVAIVLGVFWGTLIFNLDRFIVSTIKKGSTRYSQVLQIIPRALLAIFLAIVISKPLELRIFKQEIDEALHLACLARLEAVNNDYTKKIDRWHLLLQQMKEKVEQRYVLREKYYEEYRCECDGSCGTGARGIGSECLRKEKKYNKADQEYKDVITEQQALTAQAGLAIRALEQERDGYQASLRNTFATGLLAQLEALHQLPQGPSLAIIFLLIFIEVSPILAKLLSPAGPYDHVLKTLEYDYEIEELSSINIRNQKLNNQLTLLASVEQQQVEQQLKHNRETINLIEKAHQELVREQLSLWVEQEKIKLRENAWSQQEA